MDRKSPKSQNLDLTDQVPIVGVSQSYGRDTGKPDRQRGSRNPGPKIRQCAFALSTTEIQSGALRWCLVSSDLVLVAGSLHIVHSQALLLSVLLGERHTPETVIFGLCAF